jgi:ubiquinone/menaquinone biosynthesis C-methylase UbiE
MSDANRGQIDTSAAEVYDSLFAPALFGRFADAVAETAGINPADNVVDVACGTAPSPEPHEPGLTAG